LCVLACAISALLAAPAHGAARIDGGRVVDAVEAPWAVMIALDQGKGHDLWCSGSLIGPATVITAAHCSREPIANYRVYAGWRVGSSARPLDAAFDQVQTISAIRAHPGYRHNPRFGSYDDVALFQLAAPMNVSGPRVRPIGLADAPATPGAVFHVQGFGDKNPKELRTMQITFDPRWAPTSTANGLLTNLCPGATAVLRCGTSPDSGTCGGDSGGGVVTQDLPPRLIAVDSVGDRPCGPRRANGFTEITAPEIRSWLAGNPTPVFAPRVSAGPLFTTALPLGTVQCLPGTWSGTPSLTFTFLDATTTAVLQSRVTSTYRPTLQDAGRRIRCVVTAANAGGIAEAGTGVAMSVPRAWGLAVVGRRITTAHFERLTSGRRAALTFTDARGQERKRISLRPKRPLRRMIPRLPASTYDVCLELTAGALFTGWRECAKAIVDARAATLVRPARASRRGARFRVRLRGRAPAIGQQVTATWRAARCRSCAGRRLASGPIVLEERTSLRSPRVPRGRWLRLRITLPELPSEGARYTASTATFTIGRRP
jgi:hypothetical protein